jgi:CDGSH-type Zn-finger protein
MNRKQNDEGLDETNATIPSNSTYDTRIERNFSSELELPQTLVSKCRRCGSNLAKPFCDLVHAERGETDHIYR